MVFFMMPLRVQHSQFANKTQLRMVHVASNPELTAGKTKPTSSVKYSKLSQISSQICVSLISRMIHYSDTQWLKAEMHKIFTIWMEMNNKEECDFSLAWVNRKAHQGIEDRCPIKAKISIRTGGRLQECLHQPLQSGKSSSKRHAALEIHLWRHLQAI